MTMKRKTFSCPRVQREARPTPRIHLPALTLRALWTCVALLSLAPMARAQEPPKPSKEHEPLQRLVGTWEVESEFGSGTMTYKLELNGLWLVSDFDGEFGGVKIKGKGLETYDPATKKYRSIWVDSLSTLPRILEGDLDQSSQVMTLTGEGPWQAGVTAKYKSVTEFKNADTVNFGLFVVEESAKEQPLVTITYKRKK